MPKVHRQFRRKRQSECFNYIDANASLQLPESQIRTLPAVRQPPPFLPTRSVPELMRWRLCGELSAAP